MEEQFYTGHRYKSYEVPAIKEIQRRLHYAEPKSRHCLQLTRTLKAFRTSPATYGGLRASAFVDWNSESHQQGLDMVAEAFLDANENGNLYWPDQAGSPNAGRLQYSEQREYIRCLIKQWFWQCNKNDVENRRAKEQERLAEQGQSQGNPINVDDADRAGSRVVCLKIPSLPTGSSLSESTAQADQDDFTNGVAESHATNVHGVMGGFVPARSARQTPTASSHPADTHSPAPCHEAQVCSPPRFSEAVPRPDERPIETIEAGSKSKRKSSTKATRNGPKTRHKKQKRASRDRSPGPRAIWAWTSTRQRRRRHSDSWATDEQLRTQVDESGESRSSSPEAGSSYTATEETVRAPTPDPVTATSLPEVQMSAQAPPPEIGIEDTATCTPLLEIEPWILKEYDEFRRDQNTQGLLEHQDADLNAPGQAAPQAPMTPMAPSMTSPSRLNLSEEPEAAFRKSDMTRTSSERCVEPARPQSVAPSTTPRAPPSVKDFIREPSKVAISVNPPPQSGSEPDPKMQSMHTMLRPQTYGPLEHTPPITPTDSMATSTLAPLETTSLPPPESQKKPVISFKYFVVKARTPSVVIQGWIPTQKFSGMSLAAFEQDVPHQLSQDAKGWLFMLTGPGLEYKSPVPRDRADLHKLEVEYMEKLIRTTISRNQSLGDLAFSVHVQELVNNKQAEVVAGEYKEEIDF